MSKLSHYDENISQKNIFFLCEIWGFHERDYDDYRILRVDTLIWYTVTNVSDGFPASIFEVKL
jgi:hypothetical protein